MSYHFSYKDWRHDSADRVAFLVKADERRDEELPPSRGYWNELSLIAWNPLHGLETEVMFELLLDRGYSDYSPEHVQLNSLEELDALILLLQKVKAMMEMQPAQETRPTGLDL